MAMCFTYYSCFVTLFTGFIKHIFYGGLKIYSSQLGFNQHCILQTTILALKWPMCADVPLNHIKIKLTLDQALSVKTL